MAKSYTKAPPLALPWELRIDEIPVLGVDADRWSRLLRTAEEESSKSPTSPAMRPQDGRDCDLAALASAFSRLQHSLFEAGLICETQPREGAKAALHAVLEYLESFPGGGSFGSLPLRTLLADLDSLDRGSVSPMLRPKESRRGRPVALHVLLFRGCAAGMAEGLRRDAGQALPVACDSVAERLDAAGCRLAGRSDHDRITWRTVRAWRRQALERAPHDPMREAFEAVLRFCFADLVSDEPAADQLAAMVEVILRELAVFGREGARRLTGVDPQRM